ncbi:DAK2 domain-containing protein [Salibacterium salarium]|uniref:DAK2 domain-containing protein n=1 Tax=Salibacterium salarium TaxID=284579 RepID=A0A428MZ35_9BACI|nr:DAK2 domain-containing protein [Salibacterium salarium]RSL31414.1 DAK2 domain-containing protein [Salibacterium salarium]
MFKEGASALSNNVKQVDALNVFPVPDGDTGTNMHLTISSGVEEVKTSNQNHAGEVAKSFSKGLLMGARGNSGVILSQLFRGFSKAVEKKKELTVLDLNEAVEQGVNTAYKAVMKPVEGTILTVAKDAVFQEKTSTEDSPVDWMRSILQHAEFSLQKTPDLLPVLKEVGVVDSGGQGLVYIYKGMLEALLGKTSTQKEESTAPSLEDMVKIEHHQNAQSHLSTDDIKYGYCTEVMVKFEEEKLLANSYDENAFKNELNQLGDSLLVVSDEDLMKIHIHAEYPGEVLTKAQAFGSLIHVKVDNMREQHQALAEPRHDVQQNPNGNVSTEKAPAPYGFVTVSVGDGVEALFRGLGANQVVAGGQTMNPSTEDIVNAINNVNADNIFVLPNNGNVVMAAEQAAEVIGSHIHVIPTKTVPQGLSAMFVFDENSTPLENKDEMEKATKQVKTGQVTYAVRDTMMDGLEIKKGDYMGLAEKEIVASGPTMEKVTMELLSYLVDDDDEIVTLIRGEDVNESAESAISSYMEEAFPNIEIETHEGGQPLYSYIIAVE